jgi:glycyl-tRNA synthetase
MLGTTAEDAAAATRAAQLCKSDLMTNMVVEMTSLQGIMGEIYAVRSGESGAVGQAIREQYLPRFAGDAVPASPAGLALALAEKLDSLAGLFAVKAIPTGSADPFGLRRAALGIVNSLVATATDFSVRAGLEAAARLQPVAVSADAVAETAAFVTRRLEGVLGELGFAHDVVDAVLAVRGDSPAAAVRAATALAAAVRQPWWSDAFTAYARTARITRGLSEQLALDPAVYVEPVEQELEAAWQAAAAALAAATEPADVLAAQLQALQAPINAYFEKVLVNAEDERLRRARLALVQRVAALPAGIGDLSRLQGF